MANVESFDFERLRTSEPSQIDVLTLTFQVEIDAVWFKQTQNAGALRISAVLVFLREHVFANNMAFALGQRTQHTIQTAAQPTHKPPVFFHRKNVLDLQRK